MLKTLAIASVFLLLTACSRDSATQPTTPVAAGGDSAGNDPGAAKQEPAHAADHTRLGAAAWLPANYAYYSSVQGLGPLLEDIGDSRAFQSIMRLPMVLKAIQQVAPQLQAMAQMRSQMPLLDDLLILGGEAADREIFVACGNQMEGLAKALTETLADLFFTSSEMQMPSRNDVSPNLLVEAMLPHRDSLHMPPIVIGMRIRDTDRAKALVTKLAPYAQLLPGVEVASSAPTGFQSWTMKDRSNAAEIFRPQLEATGITANNIDTLLSWFATQQVTLAIGVRNDFLLFSIGSSNEHLQAFEQGPALATLPVFARARARADTPLTTTYLSPGLRPRTDPDADRLIAFLRPNMPELQGREAFLQDLHAMLQELGTPKTTPSPYLSVTYRNEGLETTTIDARQNQVDSNEPLAILSHAGANPTVAYASRASKAMASYQRFVHWTKTMFGHFETMVVPSMGERGRDEFQLAVTVFGPAAIELDAILQQVLLPAIDEHESLLLLDQSMPVTLGQFAGPLAELEIPKLALAWKVSDQQQVVIAFERMGIVVNRMLAAAAAERGTPAPTMPPLKVRVSGDSTFYCYELPQLPPTLQPCVMIKGDRIVFALTAEHAAAVMATSKGPTTDTAKLTQGASSASTTNIAAISDLLVKNAMQVLREIAQAERMHPGETAMIWSHIEAVLQAMGTLGSYTSRTWHEGDETIQHSWLHVSGAR